MVEVLEGLYGDLLTACMTDATHVCVGLVMCQGTLCL